MKKVTESYQNNKNQYFSTLINNLFNNVFVLVI